jgi:hypothetical protein
MIVNIVTPDFWSSVFHPVNYSFNNRIPLGPRDVTDSTTVPTNRMMLVTGYLSLISVGSIITYYQSLSVITGTVIGFEGNYAILNLPAQGSSFTGLQAELHDNSEVTLRLKYGHVDTGYVGSIDFYSIPVSGLHTVDVSGYLQDLFRNIAQFNNGDDVHLYKHYQLFEVHGTVEYPVGAYRVGVYSTVEDFDSSVYYTNRFMNDTLIQHNGGQYTWTRLIDDRLLTYYTGLPPGPSGLCLPVTVENSDASYSVSIASGGSLILADTTYNIYVAGNPTPVTFDLPTLKTETINIVWL